MYHQSIQEKLSERFMKAFNACIASPGHWNKNICGSDQVILSHIRNKHEDFFHQIGYGYGHLINRMFLDHDPVSNVTELKDLCYEQNGNVALIRSFQKPEFNNMCAEAWGIDVVPLPSEQGGGGDHGKNKRKSDKSRKQKQK
jgi:hypothetical protein